MKINPHSELNTPQTINKSQKSQRSQASQTVNSTAVSNATSTKGSTVDISDDARFMQKALEVAKTTPTNTEKVANLKKLVTSGQYKVDTAKLADKLLDEHLNTDFGKNNL